MQRQQEKHRHQTEAMERTGKEAEENCLTEEAKLRTLDERKEIEERLASSQIPPLLPAVSEVTCI